MISYGAAGTIAYSAALGTSVAPAYPAGVTTGQMLVLVVGQKPSTANSGTVTTPAGWTLAGQTLYKGGYGATLTTSVGNTNLYFFTMTAASALTGTLSVTLATNAVSWAQIYRFTTDSTWAASGYVDTAVEAMPSSPMTVTTSSGIDLKPGDLILGAFNVANWNNNPVFSAELIQATGFSIPTTTEISEPITSTSTDVSAVTFYAMVGTGTNANVPIQFTTTIGITLTNIRGPIGFLRLSDAGGLAASINKVSATELLLAENAATAPVQKVSAAELLLAENPAFPPPVQKLSAAELLLAETYTSTQVQYIDAFDVHVVSSENASRYIDAFEVYVVSSVTGTAVELNDVWVWDGTTKIPANVTVWDGSAKIETSISVT